MPLVPVLVGLEICGLLFDRDSATRYTKEISAKMELLQREASELIGRPLNLGSSQQMAALLFDELELQISKMKKTAGGSRLALNKGEIIFVCCCCCSQIIIFFLFLSFLFGSGW